LPKQKSSGSQMVQIPTSYNTSMYSSNYQYNGHNFQWNFFLNLHDAKKYDRIFGMKNWRKIYLGNKIVKSYIWTKSNRQNFERFIGWCLGSKFHFKNSDTEKYFPIFDFRISIHIIEFKPKANFLWKSNKNLNHLLSECLDWAILSWIVN
jgi:hypothetical protein